MKLFLIKIILIFLFGFSGLFPASFTDMEFLSTDWGGNRTKLKDMGFELSSRYIFEYWNVEKKFKEQPESFYIQNIDIDFIFDFEKIFGWKGASMLFDLQGMNGENPNSSLVRSFQGISNIEAWNNFLIYEWWYQQNLFDNKLSFLIGLFDLNSEFDLTSSKGDFLCPSHGVGTDLALTGVLGPSIFPLTSLAFRTKYTPNNNFSFSFGVFDGIPGDTNHLIGTHLVLKNSDGLLVIGESKFINSLFPYSDFKLGFWYYTDEYRHIVSGIKQWGVYAIGEHTFLNPVKSSDKGLTASLRFGYSDPRTNFTDIFVAGAVRYKGFCDARNNDSFGFGFAYSRLTEFFHRRFSKPVFSKRHYDLNFEFFYKFQATGFLSLQPVITYFIYPASNPIYDGYIVGGLRLFVQI